MFWKPISDCMCSLLGTCSKNILPNGGEKMVIYHCTIRKKITKQIHKSNETNKTIMASQPIYPLTQPPPEIGVFWRSIRGNEWIILSFPDRTPAVSCRENLWEVHLEASGTRWIIQWMDWIHLSQEEKKPGCSRMYGGFPKMVVSQNGWWK